MRRRAALGLILAAPVLAFATLSLWIPLLIFRPRPLPNPEPSAWGVPEARLVTIPGRGGERLTGWWQSPEGASPVLLILHGRSGNISGRAGIIRRLAAVGFGVLMIDYRGYGASKGRASEAGLSEDALVAYGWLRTHGVDAERLIVVGQSLGNAPAARLAAARPVRALVLVSPFTNLQEAAAERVRWLPIGWLRWPRNRFDVETSVSKLAVPVVLVASASDDLVPLANSLQLTRRVYDPHWIRADDRRHDGLLAGVAERGALARALRALPPSP